MKKKTKDLFQVSGLGYSGPQQPPPDNSIKGSVGNKNSKPAEETENQNKEDGQTPWMPNEGFMST